MLNLAKFPKPLNEPIKTHAPGTPERTALQAELTRQLSTPIEIPLIIGGQEIKTGKTVDVRCPHDHAKKLATAHMASKEQVTQAIEASKKAWKTWSRAPGTDRAAVFLKAAELLSGKYRATLNAATMLGQSKNVQQAEIDSACELIDFWRFNAWFMQEIYRDQPPENSPGTWNQVEYRPLEGYVLAITPFNFTAIGGNLPTAPALMGNTALWKPATTALLSAYYVMRILKEAGLPDGVINFIPGSGREIGDIALNHRDLAGVHFTGSTAVFNNIWKQTGENLGRGVYRSYPRLVGETGGKDFVFAWKDADPEALAVALFRGAFEYQGQKCSAASRAYVPRNLWPEIKERMAKMAKEAKMGDVTDFTTFIGAVIDKASFENISGYLQEAAKASDAKIVIGGECDSSRGWFVSPTVIETTNPKFRTMQEEIFGPVLTVYPYDENKLDETLQLLDETSPYALTGAIFAQDRLMIRKLTDALTHSAGNFYINDKPTGAVVGQQPFGGARASGTNDKAGSPVNLLRWTSLRTIKETFSPPLDWRYPHQKS